MPDDQTEPNEDEKERVNRELIELLNELRVALPGVQVLFAFLLAVPFSDGFSNVTPLQKGYFFVALLCAAMSSVLLIAPSSYHRLHFRSKDKEELIFTANKLSIWGTAFLAVAMVAAILFITDFLFHAIAAGVAAAVAAAAFMWFWYGLPLVRRRNG